MPLNFQPAAPDTIENCENSVKEKDDPPEKEKLKEVKEETVTEDEKKPPTVTPYVINIYIVK